MDSRESSLSSPVIELNLLCSVSSDHVVSSLFMFYRFSFLSFATINCSRRTILYFKRVVSFTRSVYVALRFLSLHFFLYAAYLSKNSCFLASSASREAIYLAFLSAGVSGIFLLCFAIVPDFSKLNYKARTANLT